MSQGRCPDMLFSLSLFFTQHCFSSFHLSTYHRHTHTIRHSVSLPIVAPCHLTLQNTINTHTLNLQSVLCLILLPIFSLQHATNTHAQPITWFPCLILLSIFSHFNPPQRPTYSPSLSFFTWYCFQYSHITTHYKHTHTICHPVLVSSNLQELGTKHQSVLPVVSPFNIPQTHTYNPSLDSCIFPPPGARHRGGDQEVCWGLRGEVRHVLQDQGQREWCSPPLDLPQEQAGRDAGQLHQVEFHEVPGWPKWQSCVPLLPPD